MKHGEVVQCGEWESLVATVYSSQVLLGESS